MESYKLLVFFHVLTVTISLGVTFAYPIMQSVAERSGTAATRIALQTTERIEKFIVLPGNVVLFLAGVGLIFDDATGYKDDFPVWLMVAIPWYLAAVAVSVFVMGPLGRKALKTLEGRKDEALPAAYEPIGKRMQMIGGMLGLSTVAILFLMVWKPGQ